jgi:hypothetical protein
VDWPLVRACLKEFNDRHPRSKVLMNEYALVMAITRNAADTRLAVEALHGVADPSVWSDKWLSYALRLAYGDPR